MDEVSDPRVIVSPVGFIEVAEDAGECPSCDGTGMVSVVVEKHVMVGLGQAQLVEFSDNMTCDGCGGTGRLTKRVRKDLRELGVTKITINHDSSR